jgi:hypothetical protein
VNVCEVRANLADPVSMTVPVTTRSVRFGSWVWIAALAGVATATAHASADEIALRPGYQVGDRYALALVTDTKTRVDARGAARKAFRENVELRYSAQVEVLETNATGAPVRERHEKVDLRYVRPEGAKSLFKEGATFDLARRSDGTVTIRFQGERIDDRIERIVGDLLAHQSEYAVAALLDPGHPVAIGDRWELEPARVQEFLRARGIRDATLDRAATAQLEAGKGDQLVVRYRVPIRELALPEMPAGADRTDSDASLEGEVDLDGRGLHRIRAHRSKLALEVDGALRGPGGARSGWWTLERSQSVDQHTETLKDQLASSL